MKITIKACMDDKLIGEYFVETETEAVKLRVELEIEHGEALYIHSIGEV